MQHKFFLYILSFFNIIKFISSAYSFGQTINRKLQNFEYSMQKDMGQCTCNLSPLCDYNCPCDEDCGSAEKKGKDRLEEFKCTSLRERFQYNKNNAGISVKDHIFSLMCIHFDRSGDMGEFYKEKPNENAGEKNNWITSFFHPPNPQHNNQYINLYKPDSNGYCMKTNISELKNTEFSCIKSDKIDNINVDNPEGAYPIPEESKSPNTGGFYYGNTQILNFKVSWNTNTENNHRPKGYLQGIPLKIEYNGQKYDQYYLSIINNDGICLDTENRNTAINIKPIIFKNNAIYSCLLNNIAFSNTFLYNFLLNSNRATICSSPDKENCNININFITPDIKDNNNININLYIFTSKEGKESSPYEIIKGSLATVTQTPLNSANRILTLKIKYYDISASSYHNTKDGKITSLTSLPNEILNLISVND